MSKLICASNQKCAIISSVISYNTHPNLFVSRDRIMEHLFIHYSRNNESEWILPIFTKILYLGDF